MFKILRDHPKQARGIHVDADYLFTWGPGYVPDGSSYPVDTLYVYDKQKNFVMDGMIVGFGQDIQCATSTDTSIIAGGGGSKDLTGYRYSVMRVYNRATQLLLHDWGGDEYRVTSMFVDDKYLYAGTSDGLLIVHDKQTLREVKSIYGYEDGAASNQIASDDSWIYGRGKKGSVKTWDMQTFKPGNDLEASEGVVQFVITSMKGERLHAASTDGTITSWDTRTRASMGNVKAHDGAFRAIALEGTCLFSAGMENTIKVWAITESDGKQALHEIVSFKEASPITTLQADKDYLHVGHEDGTIAIMKLHEVLS